MLRVTKPLDGAKPGENSVGQIYVVGPYSHSGGLGLLWLFTAGGELSTTGERAWVDEYFEVVRVSTARDWYLFPDPWPPQPPS